MDTDAPAPAPAEEEPAAPPDPASLYRADIRSAQASVERFVTSREPRFAQAALKLMACLRKAGLAAASPTQPVLAAAIASAFGPSHPLRERLLAALPPPAAEPEAADAAGAEGKEGGEAKKRPLLPEMELILELLVLLALIDGGKLPVALSLADALLERVASWNRRTLDPFAERAYFYSSWAYEKAGKIEAVRSRLLAAQRTSCLHHNTACQATLLNSLLRSYMSAKLFVQADKLLAKSAFPEQASNGQLARYLYYTGRIKALQLEYSEAHRCLLQAQRKAPQSSSKAVGFKLTAHKLGAIVQLLLGEIPERAVFRASSTRAPMRPYLKLVQAVRTGDLAAFRDAMAEHAAVFAADGNAALVLRLRQNVIRAGLRNVSLAYSRIHLSDAAAKLALDTPGDMESIAAKAIRDGVIDATIDHEAGVLISSGSADTYSTLEPQAAYHKRITFCLNLHNDAVKAMSYPPDAHKGDLPDADAIKERQREEQELAEALAEEDEF